MKTPIVWTIAGSDSSGSAGIQADLKTFQGLGVHGCSIITAITAQHFNALTQVEYLTPNIIEAQLAILQETAFPRAIKIGMLGQFELSTFLSQYTGYSVLDPVMISTSGKPLFPGKMQEYIEKLQKLFPLIDVLTPNLPETAALIGQPIHSYEEITYAAKKLLERGVKNVLIKGGHGTDATLSQDYWTDGKNACWLASSRYLNKRARGTGCTFASAIAATLAAGYSFKDAIVIAKMYVNQSIRLSTHPWLHHAGWPDNQEDLPFLSSTPFIKRSPSFPDCGVEPLGLYPIVDNHQWLEELLPLGIKTVQLRVKDKQGVALEQEIQKSIAIAKHYHARLFINDHWEHAIRYQAYGVHLGQEDLSHADIPAIHQAGLRLGISTHSYYELAHAHAFKPSYIAYGPIFSTKTKNLTIAPQGIANLYRWRRILDYPLVAIGGLTQKNISEVITTGVNGVALISEITQANDPISVTKNLLSALKST